MTEKKVFKYKLCGKHAFIFCYDAPGRAFSLSRAIFSVLRKQRTRNCSLLVAAGRAKKKIAIFNAACAPNGQKNSGFVTPTWVKLGILSLESLVCATLRKKSCPLFSQRAQYKARKKLFLSCPRAGSQSASDKKCSGVSGQEFLLFFIGYIALREQRTRISPLSPLISSLKNKARLEEPVRAGKSPLSACFFTVLPVRPRANSLLQVSLGKERRKSCPLFPCVPELDQKEGIDAGTPQPRAGTPQPRRKKREPKPRLSIV